VINVKLIGIAPCYNELSKGHLERFFINIPKVVDGLVVLDDASTDGSYEYIEARGGLNYFF
jgi:glycosyltransferase involved in cell wall biosynthesis